MSSISKKRTADTGEQGMVAIMVTMILILVIGLIVLGFAQVARRNARQSLDRQLSTQAFYAAESGVNDAVKLIRAAVANGNTVAAKSSCSDTGGGFYTGLPSPDLDAATRVGYTCLLVNPTPSRLAFSDIGTGGTIVPINAAGGASIGRLTINWQTKQNTATPTTGCPVSLTNVFVNTANWNCGYGVLRFDLVPVNGPLSEGSLTANTMTSFAVPFRSGGVVSYAYMPSNTSTNDIMTVPCTNSGCQLIITNLSGSNYYMRLSSLYKDVSLDMQISDAAGTTAYNFDGAQAVVDVTGKAQDILRRIQVRVPLSGSSQNLLSDNAIQMTDSLCKRFAAMDGSGGGNAYFLSSAGLGGPNPLCQ